MVHGKGNSGVELIYSSLMEPLDLFLPQTHGPASL